jgi:hypothetical protein
MISWPINTAHAYPTHLVPPVGIAIYDRMYICMYYMLATARLPASALNSFCVASYLARRVVPSFWPGLALLLVSAGVWLLPVFLPPRSSLRERKNKTNHQRRIQAVHLRGELHVGF